jgi:PBSX family phage portal protein
MDLEKRRDQIAKLLTSDVAQGSDGGRFERPRQGLPPYLVRKGDHPLDQREEIGEKREELAKSEEGRATLAKFGFGSVVGDYTSSSNDQGTNALPSADDVHTLFTVAGALFPPYDPEVLSSLMEHSNSLRPNVDAYKTNIDGFGYRLDPVFDTNDPKMSEKLADAMYLDRLAEAELRGEVLAPYPTAEEIAKKRVEVEALMRLERAKLESWLETCAVELSFQELRRRTREDHEVTGNAYWEVVRNAANDIAEFHLVPSYSMRLAPIEHVLHDVRVRRKITPLRYHPATIRRRFRRFIQIVLDRIVFFKEFGDPRVISKRTGRVYANEEELTKDSQHDGPATEILHFKIYSPRSPYGIPRWIGNLLSVLGSRASEEVNYLYFDNKAVPPMALLISGGKLAREAKSQIESYIADNIRGKENFHKILIVEAEPAAGGPKTPQVETGRVRLELVPLRDSQQEDALFQGYDQANQDKVGSSFRVPRLLRGDTKDFNRATADAALQYAETQVFQGERSSFDDFINRTVLSEMGIRFWKFVSNSPVNRDPLDMTKILDSISETNAFLPNELREIAGDILNKVFPKLEQEWAQQPMAMTLAGLVGAGGGPDDETAPVTAPAPGPKAADGSALPTKAERALTTLAGRIISLREQFAKEAAAGFRAELAKATKEEAKTLTLHVPHETFREWVVPHEPPPPPPPAPDAPPAH